ncbi:MAG: serine/threonine protein kinase [Fusobacteriaceae bacterium]
MKKIILLFFVVVSNIFAIENYDFPYKDSLVATIVGSSTLMMENVSQYDRISVGEYELEIKPNFIFPESLWYQEDFNFSLVKQKKEAPLIFLIAGSGSTHNSAKMKMFQRIFYDAGYHVISISSSLSTNFILNASETRTPGYLPQDSKDIYKIMQAAYERVKGKIKVSDFYLVGYSLGATQAAYVSYIDETEKKFDFKRVFMINPAVDLVSSSLRFDVMLDKNVRKEDIGKLIDKVINEITPKLRGTQVALSEETIFKLFSTGEMPQKEMEILVGLVFRLISIDLNYLVDLLNNRKVYVKEPVEKFDSLFKYFERLNFASFKDYLDKEFLPYYKEKNLTEKEIYAGVKLNSIENYLKSSNKIAVVTNADELILDKNEIIFLQKTFGRRMILYPYGGHCGNMYYTPNVKNMLHFLSSGVLTNGN